MGQHRTDLAESPSESLEFKWAGTRLLGGMNPGRRALHGFCGLSVWDSRKVERVDFYAPSLTIGEFLLAVRRGRVRKLSCERFLAALAFRFRQSVDG